MLRRTLLPLFLLILSSISLQASELEGRVTWIYDGDTLQVENIGKVRLIGIDTPEYEASSRDNFYFKSFAIEEKTLRKISRQAKNHNLRYAKGKNVRLESEQSKRDKHDRLLAYVYLPDGEMLNLLLLKEGLASVFRRYDFRYKKEFLKVEERARRNKRGLWEK
ncbi:MAG: thermonuclease family protein [Deltaproteobacteria bacterium]|jgi:micrococcal nuclease|nr:thermonuclease family protein [Deltaproteobacteria bacterium]MCW9049759.1 thermonuclease family protein [Deltaproteobacteria bacterium]